MKKNAYMLFIRINILPEMEQYGKWNNTAVPPNHRTQQHNIVHCRAGPKNLPRVLTEFVQAFRLYLSDNILKKIVLHTNAEVTKIYPEKQSQTTWKPTDKTEILEYVELVMATGHLKQNHLSIEKIWHKKMDHLFSWPL